MQYNRSYLKSFRGILRILIIVTLNNSSSYFFIHKYQVLFFKVLLTGGWLAALLANTITNTIDFGPGYGSTRIAYIIIAVTAQSLSIIIFLFYIFNIDQKSCFNKLNLNFIVRMKFKKLQMRPIFLFRF